MTPATQRLIAELREAARDRWQHPSGATVAAYNRVVTPANVLDLIAALAESDDRLRSATRALQEIADSGPIHSMPMQCVKIARAALEAKP